MERDYLDAPTLKTMVRQATQVLDANKAGVDALNVFPVPDGDTGTNMSLTMQSARREVDKASQESLGAVAEALTHGSLMGARGNSGVILSQIFRGFARGLEGKKRAGALEVAWAFQEATDTAYKAVMKPVEGTMLTVVKEFSRQAMHAARQGAGLRDMLESAFAHGETVLARTPELLPVLKQAGVVDAGGRGLLHVLNGFLGVLRGVPLAQERAPAVRAPEFALTEEIGDIHFVYDVELLLRGKGLPLDGIREALTPEGDCLLVVGTPELGKVHIHTNRPGFVLDYCLDYGEIVQVEVKNMKEQHDELKDAAYRQAPTPALPKAIGVITVATGDGLIDIFRSLGADKVVNGGQSMNPSTEEIVQALDACPSERLLILPNNKNIIMAAEQASRLCGRDVAIVPTRSIPQGISALLALHPDLDLDTNRDRMLKAFQRVRTGEVTFAVRSTKVGGFSIAEGDIIGLVDDEVAAVGKSPEDVLLELLKGQIKPNDSVVTIYYGEDVAPERAEQVGVGARELFGEVEVELQFGGQPLYYYLFSVE
ncbi:MAG: DAK2 domain-containing protein [Bacillota bacterium]